MITNKKLYEMIAEQMNDSNGSLRDQLRSQILAGTSETTTMAQELADRQRAETSELSKQIHDRLDALQKELHAEMHQAETENSEMIVMQLTETYDQKMEALKSELFEKLDEQFAQMMNASKSLADGITSLQKDTAVIMETLQLILTNMMLNKVENQFSERNDQAS